MNSRLGGVTIRLSIVLSLVAMLPMWLELLSQRGVDTYYTVPARSVHLVRAISLTAFISALGLLVVGRDANRCLLVLAWVTLGIAFLLYVLMPHNWVVGN